MKKIGIIGAMEVEVQTLASSMTGEDGTGDAKLIKSAHLSFYDGMLSGVRAVVVKSGVGKVNAALCAERLISELRNAYRKHRYRRSGFFISRRLRHRRFNGCDVSRCRRDALRLQTLRNTANGYVPLSCG